MVIPIINDYKLINVSIKILGYTMKKKNRENIMLFIKRILIIEIILITFPILFYLFTKTIGVGHPDLLLMMISAIPSRKP